MEDSALNKFFVWISAIVVLVASIWVWTSHNLGQQELERYARTKGIEFRSTFRAEIDKYSNFVLQSAQFVADDATVNDLFSQAYAAHREGDVAQLNSLREALYQHLSTSWDGTEAGDFRDILHFHFPPATSFLRMHEPTRFGDDLSAIRASIVAVNSHLEPVSGYETGRYFRGLRGVTPVFAGGDSEAGHIGAVEVGISLASVLGQLARQTNTEFAVLLLNEHVEQRTASDRLETYLRGQPVGRRHVVEWTSDEDATRALIDRGLIAPMTRGFGSQVVGNPEARLGVTQFSLYEFDGNGNQQAEPIGTIYAWFSIQREVIANNERMVQTLIMAIFMVLLVEVILYFAFVRERDLRIERSVSLTDGLTGIANRRHFDETLEQEVRRATRSGANLAVILCDIDHFKLYNDHYGHQQGDDCILKVAKALTTGLRRAGDFVARYGGEEFVVILPDSNEQDASVVAERLRKAVESLRIPHEKHHSNTVVTVSLGITSGPILTPDASDSLVACADTALYAAKAEGRNCIRSEEFRSRSPANPLLYR